MGNRTGDTEEMRFVRIAREGEAFGWKSGRGGGARGLVTCTTAVNGDNDDDDDASERHRKCIRANGLEQARGQNACENAYITDPSER